MLGSLTSLTGGGGLSNSSSASTGPFQGGDSGFNGGGINFAPQGAANNPLLIVGVVVVAYLLISKKR